MTTEPDDAAIGAAYGRLFAGLDQLGPGSTATRQEVLERLAPHLPASPRIADMGCGAGVAALDLAAALPTAQVTAIDTHAGFLAAFRAKAANSALITTVEANMAAPPLAPSSLDLIWCESAIYSVGREIALAAWRKLLAPGGLVAFSDVVWTIDEPPADLRAFWADEYPAMVLPSAVEAEIAAAGYRLVERHLAPVSDWQAYYAPLRPRVGGLAGDADDALALVLDVTRREIAIFDAFADNYAAIWFIAQPVA